MISESKLFDKIHRSASASVIFSNVSLFSAGFSIPTNSLQYFSDSISIAVFETVPVISIFFIRSPLLQLTDVGMELYNRSLQIIGLAESIPEEITKFRDTHVGDIRIGIPPIIGASFFPMLIGEFRKQYPGITIKLVESGSKSIINQLDEGKFDIGIVCSCPERIAKYWIKEFISSPLMVVINNQNPVSKSESLIFEDIMDQNFILFQEDFSL